MPRYKRTANFPTPFIPGASELGLKDPFGSTLGRPGGGPAMAGGGTTVSGGVTIEMVRALIADAIPRHPWKIMVTNTYDYTDPDVPIYVSSMAVVYPGSVVFSGAGSYGTTIAVSGIGTVWVPTNGTYLYISGTVNISGNVTGITLTSGASLPARITFSGVSQTNFNAVIGRFLQLGDGSFVAEQWVHTDLTVLEFCVSNLGARYTVAI